MRSYIRAALIADSTLQSLGVTAGGVVTGDVDTPRPRPFVNLKWGVNNPGLAHVTKNVLTVWVHDEPNDYTRINAIIRRVRAVLTAIEGVAWSEVDAADVVLMTGYVTAIAWESDSSDLSDEGHRTITRQSNFVVIGS